MKATFVGAVALSLIAGTASAAYGFSDLHFDSVTGGCVALGCCGPGLCASAFGNRVIVIPPQATTISGAKLGRDLGAAKLIELVPTIECFPLPLDIGFPHAPVVEVCFRHPLADPPP